MPRPAVALADGGDGGVLALILTSSGSRRCVWATRRMASGMVAENSAVWRSAGRVLEDPFDVVDEAHAQHFVGFVEHHQRSQAVEVEALALEVVHDAAGVPTITWAPRAAGAAA
jgi:hypothetical protein